MANAKREQKESAGAETARDILDVANKNTEQKEPDQELSRQSIVCPKCGEQIWL